MIHQKQFVMVVVSGGANHKISHDFCTSPLQMYWQMYHWEFGALCQCAW
jgi:hypothetical protein